jgi:hypothetical protein
MTELLMAKGWPDPDSVAILLRDVLPQEYVVVADPSVHGQPFDAVVVGPQGLFAILAKNWEGEITPARRGAWLAVLPSGREVRYSDPAQEARRAEQAISVFLRDEFPGLSPAIHHLLVLLNPEASLAPAEIGQPVAVLKADLAATITGMPAPRVGGLADAGTREALAVALRDRQLTASQRASAPFVFRSGGLLSSRKAWTIREVVEHIDHHPEDGYYHLHNGTLEEWFSAQGAGHMSELAHEAMSGRESDRRAMVETFLVGTGLVHRSRPKIEPKRLHLGPVPSGTDCSARLKVRKGPGRGYLFGRVRTSESWLRVEPSSFRERLDAVVSVDTESLPISQTPWQANILIESSASDEEVPVQVRVVGMPSAADHYVLRPLAGTLIAGLVGAATGAGLGAAGLAVPAWLPGFPPVQWTPVMFWALVIGLFWALLGGLRGLRQPGHWPASYAIGRFILRLAAWGAILALLAGLGRWAWMRLAPLPQAGSEVPSTGVVILGGLALAILPATVEEMLPGRRQRARQKAPSGRYARRPLLLVAIGLLLTLAVVVGLPLLLRAWQSAQVGAGLSSAGDRATDTLGQWETKFNEWLDRTIRRSQDRRAPEQPASTLTPSVAATPGPAGTATPKPGTRPTPAPTGAAP